MPPLQGVPFQGTGDPEAEKQWFQRWIQQGDVTPYQGLFFNDPMNDRSKRTWYNEYGQIVPGYGTEGPAGPYAQGGGNTEQANSIAQIMNDLTLQRVAKTFDWQGEDLPGVKSFKGGGYWWSDDPTNAFAVPQAQRGIQGVVQQMIQGGGGPWKRGPVKAVTKTNYQGPWGGYPIPSSPGRPGLPGGGPGKRYQF